MSFKFLVRIHFALFGAVDPVQYSEETQAFKTEIKFKFPAPS